MAQPPAIDVLVGRVTRQIRRRRAEHDALRGAFWALLVAVALFLFKGSVGALALPAGIALVAAAALAGGAWGAIRRVDPVDAARLADRAFALDDRVATALEWGERPDQTPLVEALVTDTVARVQSLEPRWVVRRVVPRESRWLPVPVLAAVLLALLPPVPLPTGRLPDFLPSGEPERPEERAQSTMLEARSRALGKDPLKRPGLEERDFAAREGAAGASSSGDLSAIFKDTSLSARVPDFNSFLKKGDERLKLLEQADRLPDLQSDYTNTQYKMVFRKSKALTGGLSPDISPTKLRELLQEMERLGRKGGNWSGDAAEGMEALEGGQTDRALQAMQRALEKMRAQDEAQRSGKGLRGGRDNRGGRDRGRGGDGVGSEDQDFGEGEGMLPGRGRSTRPKGEATARLRANPFDVGVEGESRQGRKAGYDTNLTGRGAATPSRLQYLGVIGQYRKMMEDAITREHVPRDYHEQIRNYFQALDER